jgi:hypothetical protein
MLGEEWEMDMLSIFHGVDDTFNILNGFGSFLGGIPYDDMPIRATRCLTKFSQSESLYTE